MRVCTLGKSPCVVWAYAYICRRWSIAGYAHQRDTRGTLESESDMARSIRAAQLETRTARLKLELRKKPHTVRVAPGVRLGYRRNNAAGTWSVIAADGKSGN